MLPERPGNLSQWCVFKGRVMKRNPLHLSAVATVPPQGLLWRMSSTCPLTKFRSRRGLIRRPQGREKIGREGNTEEGEEKGQKKERIKEISFSESLCKAKCMKIQRILNLKEKCI
jgi:hypothetical protein